jgi:hypothetical protein
MEERKFQPGDWVAYNKAMEEELAKTNVTP